MTFFNNYTLCRFSSVFNTEILSVILLENTAYDCVNWHTA